MKILPRLRYIDEDFCSSCVRRSTDTWYGRLRVESREGFVFSRNSYKLHECGMTYVRSEVDAHAARLSVQCTWRNVLNEVEEPITKTRVRQHRVQVVDTRRPQTVLFLLILLLRSRQGHEETDFYERGARHPRDREPLSSARQSRERPSQRECQPAQTQTSGVRPSHTVTQHAVRPPSRRLGGQNVHRPTSRALSHHRTPTLITLLA